VKLDVATVQRATRHLAAAQRQCDPVRDPGLVSTTVIGTPRIVPFTAAACPLNVVGVVSNEL